MKKIDKQAKRDLENKISRWEQMQPIALARKEGGEVWRYLTISTYGGNFSIKESCPDLYSRLKAINEAILPWFHL